MPDIKNLTEIFEYLNGEESRAERQEYILFRSREMMAPLIESDCNKLITSVLNELKHRPLSLDQDKLVVSYLTSTDKPDLSGKIQLTNSYFVFYLTIKDGKPFLIFTDEVRGTFQKSRKDGRLTLDLFHKIV